MNQLTIASGLMVLLTVVWPVNPLFAQWPSSPTPVAAPGVVKPVPKCSCPECRKPCLQIPGWRGQPYIDAEPGGCRCGRHSGLTNYHFSAHWPCPASAVLDYGRDGHRFRSTADSTRSRPRDCLDRLSQVKLINYRRTDNGYRGRDCDPYGYLSQSRQAHLVDRSVIAPNSLPNPLPDVHPPYDAPKFDEWDRRP